MAITIVKGVTPRLPQHEIGFTCAGNGNPITAGEKTSIVIPYDGTIESWTLLGDVSGSVSIDIWKAASPSIPSVANTITGSAKPTLTSAQYGRGTVLTGWDREIRENDILTFNIDSVDGVLGKITLTLRVH